MGNHEHPGGHARPQAVTTPCTDLAIITQETHGGNPGVGLAGEPEVGDARGQMPHARKVTWLSARTRARRVTLDQLSSGSALAMDVI
jgi:hypothetical protein